jgi:hypothetical protein
MHIMALLLNLLLRLSIVYFLGEVLLRPDDPRFAGKALSVRNLIIVGALSLLFPALHLIGKKRESYPFWLDDLYLSVFWVDMAGNSFDLYDRFYYFDLVPHFHGTGAVTVVVQAVFRLPALSAVGLATIIHVLLEAQEYYTDVFFGTHNVRGVSDTINDLLVGLVAAAAYSAGYVPLRRRSRKTPERPDSLEHARMAQQQE